MEPATNPAVSTPPPTAVSLSEIEGIVKNAMLSKGEIQNMLKDFVKEYSIVNSTPAPAAPKAVYNIGDLALAAKRKFYGKPTEFDAQMKKDLTIGDDAQAGFMVPVNQEAEILKFGADNTIVRPRANKRTLTQGDSTSIRVWKSGTRTIAAGLYGGAICYWGSEAGSMSESNLKSELIRFSVEKLYAYLEDSAEFEEDVPNANGWIGAALAEAMARYEDYYFLLGTGVAQPLGAFNATGVSYSVSRSVGAHFSAADAYAMYTKLLQPFDPSSTCWVMNPNVIPDLAALESSAGFRIWAPDASQRLGAQLLGIPIVFTPLLPTLASAKSVCLGDFSKYGIVDRRGMRLEYDKSYLFKTDLTAYKLTSRVDAKPLMPAYITSDNSVYFSPFVYLT